MASNAENVSIWWRHHAKGPIIANHITWLYSCNIFYLYASGMVSEIAYAWTVFFRDLAQANNKDIMKGRHQWLFVNGIANNQKCKKSVHMMTVVMTWSSIPWWPSLYKLTDFIHPQIYSYFCCCKSLSTWNTNMCIFYDLVYLLQKIYTNYWTSLTTNQRAKIFMNVT